MYRQKFRTTFENYTILIITFIMMPWIFRGCRNTKQSAYFWQESMYNHLRLRSESLLIDFSYLLIYRYTLYFHQTLINKRSTVFCPSSWWWEHWERLNESRTMTGTQMKRSLAHISAGRSSRPVFRARFGPNFHPVLRPFTGVTTQYYAY